MSLYHPVYDILFETLRLCDKKVVRHRKCHTGSQSSSNDDICYVTRTRGNLDGLGEHCGQSMPHG
jgi:hypothetical protein